LSLVGAVRAKKSLSLTKATLIVSLPVDRSAPTSKEVVLHFPKEGQKLFFVGDQGCYIAEVPYVILGHATGFFVFEEDEEGVQKKG